MESSRSYSSVSGSLSNLAYLDSKRFAVRDSSDLRYVNVQEHESFSDRDGKVKEKSYDGSTSLQEWQSRMGISQSRVSMNNGQRHGTFMVVQTASIRYLFRVLMGERRTWIADLFASRNPRSSSMDTRSSSWSGGDVSGEDSYRLSRASSYYGSSLMGQEMQDIKLPQQSQNLALSGNSAYAYSHEEFEAESEQTEFSTTGTVRTSDGREISFGINVQMNREFESYFQTDIKHNAFELCDPLVINLDTDVAELSDQTFYFDLDADGILDEISSLSAASGYLAIDKNEDGSINDGNELFGVRNGDGFADLARFDEDGNGWIDENDAIFSKLKIWTKDEEGNDLIYTLADKGLGAIYLGSASTNFSLKDEAGTRGVIRSTGMFLYENGAAGTMQHVDVAKYKG